MSSDPYFSFKSEIDSTLQTAHTLHSSYLRILQTLPPSRHSTSEELQWSLTELSTTLDNLDGDLKELEGMVKVLESDGDVMKRLGLSAEEVRRRRDWSRGARRELEVSKVTCE
jgi:hypothetical protein